mgnify:CR=1 FL=1
MVDVQIPLPPVALDGDCACKVVNVDVVVLLLDPE